MANNIQAPFGKCDVLALTAAGAQAITIDDYLTIIDGATVQSTASRTLNLTINPELRIGATLYIKNKATATETFVPGTNMVGITTAGVAGKTQIIQYVYDGINFKQSTSGVQID